MGDQNLVEWTTVKAIRSASEEGALEILRAYVKWVTIGIEDGDDICTFNPETGEFTWRKKEALQESLANCKV